MIFEQLNQLMLGNFGRKILYLINENKILFSILFIFYGLIVLYGKIIYLYYIPFKIERIITENIDLTAEEQYLKWEKTKSKLPWYIVVPTKNEFWVKKLSSADGKYELLFYNKKNHPAHDRDILKNMRESLGGMK